MLWSFRKAPLHNGVLVVRKSRRSRPKVVAPLVIGFFAIATAIGSLFIPEAHAYTANAFVMVVKTDNPGTSNATSFTIPITGAGYSYNVDCNDDGINEVTARTTSYICVYGAAGTYTIAITGTFPRIYFNNGGDRQKLLEVKQWGTGAWTSMQNAFYGANNMHVTATDAPNLAGVTSMAGMFRGATSMNEDINHWNTSTITDMSFLFTGGWWDGIKIVYTSFNQPLTNWDTSAVTNMSSMFYNASAFNQPLDNWNTSAVTNMSSMFYNASAFNQPLDNWNTSAVTNMSSMFYNASAFNQPLTNWNTSAVTNMSSMFSAASAFNQPLTNWDTSAVTDMSWMFSAASAFNQPLTNWDTSAVTNMSSMFSAASAFNQPLTNWDTSAVTDMSWMFYSASAFNQPLTNWDTSAVTNMSSMFYNASAFNQPLTNWDTSAVTNMSSMFYNASAFNQPLDNWNTSAVTNMSWMFQGASAFNQPLTGWNTSAVTYMSGMFNGASAFNQPLTNWNTSAVTYMSGMFDNSGLSTANYDQTLAGWVSQTLQPNVTLGAAGVTYCNESARATLTSAPNNWTVTDGGYCPLVVTAPTNMQVVSTATPAIAGTVNAAATRAVRVTIDTTDYATTASGSNAFSFTPSTPLANGWHTIIARSLDGAGNPGVPSKLAIYVHTGGSLALSGVVPTPTLSWDKAPSTPTGTVWNKTADATASFPARGSFGAASLNGKLWVIGGQGTGSGSSSRLNDVWSSSDGVTWTQTLAHAPWSARNAHTVTAFNGKLWVMGGQTGGNSSTRLNDVWSSSDGVTWTQELSHAPWPARSAHEVVVHNNKLWLVGGADTTDADLTDVWSSSDGVTWTQETASANWPSRRGFGLASFNNKLWVMGGLINNWDVFSNDVWSSTDGITWTEETANAAWQLRASHQVEVFDGKLWVLGGSSDDWNSEYSDVWFSENGKDWIRTTEAADWQARRGHSTAVFNNKLWVLGGKVGSYWTTSNDVWSAALPEATYTICWDTTEGGCAHTATTTDSSFTLPAGEPLAKGTWYFKVTAAIPGGVGVGTYTATPYQVTDPIPVVTPLTGTPVIHPVTGAPSAVTMAPALANATLSIASYDCSDLQIPTVRLVEPDGLKVTEANITLLGGVGFNVGCTSTGKSTDVSLALGAHYNDTSKLRAYKQSGTSLVDITKQVTFTNKDVGGTTKTVVSYNLVDGGNLDEDGMANGTLVDPLFIGVVDGADGSLANTGFNIYVLVALAVALLAGACALWRKGLKAPKRVSFR